MTIEFKGVMVKSPIREITPESVKLETGMVAALLLPHKPIAEAMNELYDPFQDVVRFVDLKGQTRKWLTGPEIAADGHCRAMEIRWTPGMGCYSPTMRVSPQEAIDILNLTEASPFNLWAAAVSKKHLRSHPNKVINYGLGSLEQLEKLCELMYPAQT